MSDLIFIAVLLAFFVLCALYVQLCDHMIGPDDPSVTDTGTDSVIESTPTTVDATNANVVTA
jgi:hypothetical protein